MNKRALLAEESRKEFRVHPQAAVSSSYYEKYEWRRKIVVEVSITLCRLEEGVESNAVPSPYCLPTAGE